MNTREIEQLIAKFEEGETSLAEEQQLREFFRRGNIPVELVVYKPLFVFFEEEQKVEISNPGFDQALLSKLTGSEGKVVPMAPKRSRLTYIVSLAAAAVILVAIVVTAVMNVNPGAKYNRADQLAYAQAEEALMIVSSNLNCGVSQVRYLQAFDNGMEQVQMLSKFYEYQSLIINPDEAHAPSDKTPK